MSAMRCRAALTGIFAVLVGGCESTFESVEIEYVSGVSLGGVDREAPSMLLPPLLLTEGRVLVVRLHTNVIRGGEVRRDEPFSFSSNTSIAILRPTPLADTWMIAGLAPGTTRISVSLAGNFFDPIPVIVEEAR